MTSVDALKLNNPVSLKHLFYTHSICLWAIFKSMKNLFAVKCHRCEYSKKQNSSLHFFQLFSTEDSIGTWTCLSSIFLNNRLSWETETAHKWSTSGPYQFDGRLGIWPSWSPWSDSNHYTTLDLYFLHYLVQEFLALPRCIAFPFVHMNDIQMMSSRFCLPFSLRFISSH